MRDFVILFIHLIVTVVRLGLPGGLRSVVAESADLEEKLLDFQHYYNEHRTHVRRQGQPPVTGNADRP